MTRRRIGTKERAAIFAAAGGVCHLCGGKITAPAEAWDVEHIIPLALGGDDDGDNLRPAHAKCHRAKTAQDATNTARAKRREAAHTGAKSKPRAVIPGSKSSGWKRRIDGTTVRRET